MTTTPPEAPAGPEPAGEARTSPARSRDPAPPAPTSRTWPASAARPARTRRSPVSPAGSPATSTSTRSCCAWCWSSWSSSAAPGSSCTAPAGCSCPRTATTSAPFNFDERTRSVALVIAGIIATLALLGDTMGGYGFPWPLAIVALVVLVAVSVSDRRQDRPRPTAPPVPHTPYAGSYATPPMPQTQQGWVQPEWQAQQYATQPIQQPAPPRYRNPRKRGPILFWFTLALSALGIGVLGIADAAGAEVADSAYPALVVGDLRRDAAGRCVLRPRRWPDPRRAARRARHGRRDRQQPLGRPGCRRHSPPRRSRTPTRSVPAS